jgi:hypothetical protein
VVYLDIVVDAKANRLKTSGLEEFLRKYGVLVGTEFAMRVPEDTQDDPRGVYATVPADTTNPLAKAFLRKPIELHTARIIKPDKSAQKYKADVILQLDPKDLSLERRQNYWEDTAIRALASPITYAVELMRQGALETRLSGEPLPVAVAVSEKLMVPGSTKETFKPRLLVFGDAEMISNVGILQGRVQPGNVNYAWTARNAAARSAHAPAKRIRTASTRTPSTSPACATCPSG